MSQVPIIVLIMGNSGSGKTACLRNLNKGEAAVINVSGKPFPFQTDLPMLVTSDMKTIASVIKRNDKNCIVVDDAGLAMTFFLFNKVGETGYGKFTQVAKDFYDMIKAANECSGDTIVYFFMHTERSEDGASIKAKTAGKMIDNQLSLESLFTIVLHCVTDGKRHYLVTQSDGITTAKSPMGMFEPEIDNDLKAVDARIREYYGMAKLGTPVHKEEQKKPKTSGGTVETVDKIPG